ncbi:hypothetical protein [Paenibacillus amylolyticus]|uniref:hypothetical protein n=1 Tax=Paenibacillus amylolyticus TaxID=1451 RepID=UPI00096D3C5B|nr:hypothetical protein [Paenibacillus amylolyticus]OMF47726.1 hypothetical protein BK136_02205 [Paenibacillus amylolyticus]
MTNINEVPNEIDGLLEFWSKENVIAETNDQSIQGDILAYLGWVKALIIKRNELETDLEEMEREYEACAASHAKLEKKIVGLYENLREVSKDYE